MIVNRLGSCIAQEPFPNLESFADDFRGGRGAAFEILVFFVLRSPLLQRLAPLEKWVLGKLVRIGSSLKNPTRPNLP